MINAKIIWIDKTRANSPPLVLDDINLSYSTSDILSYLDRHLFYLDFFSSAGTKEKISADISTLENPKILDQLSEKL